ncbi:type II toxin-antitoxin system HicB family antitoxin [Providencia sneebia]|uniref:HicB-like antitoxin of toxin-antitoxin system domain-containing protein n=1 Tax=Providencia sneebia DSM 19967 TaxID=1141660 RepID=K8W830_9GAMM|nr:type II toxin-antitoxin system HicB family antitoxin [Providencia sneebia]EKT56006.1 hypothetical protein OO7_13594 [Providencia sneebia DSM 19967]
MLNYAIKPIEDTVGYMATCRDLPEFASAGDTIEDLIQHSVEALLVALDIYINEGIPIPLPSKIEQNEQLIRLSGMIFAKVYLHNSLLQSNISKSEFKKRLNISDEDLQQLFNITYNTKWEQLERAFDIIGKKLSISVSDKN